MIIDLVAIEKRHPKQQVWCVLGKMLKDGEVRKVKPKKHARGQEVRWALA